MTYKASLAPDGEGKDVHSCAISPFFPYRECLENQFIWLLMVLKHKAVRLTYQQLAGSVSLYFFPSIILGLILQISHSGLHSLIK